MSWCRVRSQAHIDLLGWFAVGSRRRFARPLANGEPQFVCPLLQLPYPLHLYRHVTTDFRDLAFNGVRQFGGFAPPLSPPDGSHHCLSRKALRHQLQAEPETQSDEDQREYQVGTACAASIGDFVLHLPFAPACGVGILDRRDE